MKNIEEKIIEHFKNHYNLNEYKDINETDILFGSLMYAAKYNYYTALKKLEDFLKGLNDLKISKDILKFFNEIKKVRLLGRGVESIKVEYIEETGQIFSKLITNDNMEMKRLLPLFVNYYICNTVTDKNISDYSNKKENIRDNTRKNDIISTLIGDGNIQTNYQNKTRNIKNFINKLKFKGDFEKVFSRKKVDRISQYFVNFYKILSINDNIGVNFSMSLIAFNMTAFGSFDTLVDENFLFDILKNYIYKSYLPDNDESSCGFWNGVNKCCGLFEKNNDREIISLLNNYDPLKKIIKPITLYYLDNTKESELNVFDEKYKNIIKTIPQMNDYDKLSSFKNTFIPLHYCILFDNAYDDYNMKEIYKECEMCKKDKNKIRNDCNYLKSIEKFKKEIEKIYNAYRTLCKNLDEYLFVKRYPHKIEIFCKKIRNEEDEEYYEYEEDEEKSIDFKVINYFGNYYRKIYNEFENYIKDKGCYKDGKAISFENLEDMINNKYITDSEILNYFNKCYGKICDNFEKYLKSRGYYKELKIPFENIKDDYDLIDFDISNYLIK